MVPLSNQLPMSSNNRISSLDYLRGVAAFSIMLYHIHLFGSGEVDASSPLARVKIYAVALFFILSGLTLFKVYEHKLSVSGVFTFYLKRIFRIVPLLWLTTAATFLLADEHYELKKIAVNFLVLPGIIKPEAFVADGAWSIGNELGFYLVFPLMIFALRYRSWLVWVLLAVFSVPFALMTWSVLDTSESLGHQWHYYVSPANQFVFFITGFLIAMFPSPAGWLRSAAPWLALASTLIILFLPLQGDPIVLASGNVRLALSLLTVLLCYAVYICDFSALPVSVKDGLSWLGEISYSVYLLHPLIFNFGKKFLPDLWQMHIVVRGGITIAVTLALSHFVYQHFEKYFMSLPQKFKTAAQTSAIQTSRNEPVQMK